MDSKTASKLQGEAPQSEREKRPDVRDFTNIPTEDPRAALQFCQSLARMLAASSNPAINNTPSASNRRRDQSCAIYSRTSAGTVCRYSGL